MRRGEGEEKGRQMTGGEEIRRAVESRKEKKEEEGRGEKKT